MNDPQTGDKSYHVNLLLFSISGKSHHCVIQNTSRLLKNQLTKHTGAVFIICNYFLHPCCTAAKLETHLERCKLHCEQLVSVPEKNDKKGRDKIRFSYIQYQLRLPFVIYADFQSILKPEVNNDAKSTTNISTHIPSSFSTYTVCSDKKFYRAQYTYSGEDAPSKFIDHIISEVDDLRNTLRRKEPMQPLSTLQQQHYSHANQCCYICKRSFNPFDGDNNNRKVRDHCHLKGDFRGAAHSICNLNLRIDPEKVRIPVVFHNLKGYDSHII